MANDLNKCMFIGRLGKDPEVRYTASGDAIANFSIAVGKQWKDKQGQKQERTEWVNCNAFGKLAEIIGEYLRKGSKVYIEGEFKTDKFTDNNGVERYATKISVQNMQMLDSKQDGQQTAPAQQGYDPQPAQNAYTTQQPQQQGYAPAPQQRPAPQPQQQQYQQAPQQQAPQQQYQNGLPPGDDWSDDGIPF